MKYKDWLVEWLRNYVKPTTKEKTYTRYAETVRLHIAPRLGELQTADISPLDLQRTVTELLTSGNLKTGKGLSANSVNVIVSVIQASLKTAFAAGVTTEYVGDKVRRPKIVEKSVTCFSLAEQRKIEEAVLKSKSDKHFGVLLCLYTGLRIGELLALQWADVDLVKCEISVTKTSFDAKDKDGKFCVHTNKPKTPSSQRVIPLPEQLLPLLKRLRRRSKSAYVVGNKRNNPISVRSYQQTFKRLLKVNGVPYKNFHSLRHTFATRALECGMDVKTLSEILGHRSPTVTLNRYAHSFMEHKKEMMNRLGQNL